MGGKKSFFSKIRSKKNVLILNFFFFLIFASAWVYSQTVPLWFQSRTFVFPESDFVSALGSGASEQDAKNDALASLSLFFGVQVDVKKSSGFQATETVRGTARQKKSSSQTDVSSKNELPAVQFTECFSSGSLCYVCAYIRRADAIAELSSRAENALSQSDFLLMSAVGADKIAAFRAAKQALDLCTAAENAARELSVLDNAKSSALYKQMREMKSRAEKIATEKRTELVFRVIADGDDGSSVNCVKEILQKEGFLCADSGLYTVFIELSFEESANAVGVFVKPSFSIQIFDAGGNAIASYTKTLSKFGHRTLEAAHSKARVEVVKDLRSNAARELFE